MSHRSNYPLLDHIEIPAATLEGWQQTVNLMAEVLEVPAGLIMRVHPAEIEVFVRSDNPENVYEAHETAPLNGELYCERVMDTRDELLVPDARKDPEWDHNPDIELGMICYLGLPLAWPDGELFGTICVLDVKENHFSILYQRLLRQFQRVITADLAQIHGYHRLEEREERLRHTLEELRRSQSVLIQESKHAALGELLVNIAHHWRQPINALGLLVQDTRDAFTHRELDEAYLDQAVNRALATIRELSHTIDRFGELFKPTLERESFAVGEVVRDLAEVMEAELRGREITLEAVVDEECEITGFRADYAQALMAILANARDALQERGAGKRWIRVVAGRSAEGRSRITVTDSGDGIPEGLVEKIFEPYFTTKEKSVGTGTGLYTAKLVVENSMGGTLRAANAPEGGARFIVEV